MEHAVYLLLGSNEGDRLRFLQKGRAAIAAQAGKIRRASRIYETAAWGKENQPAFLNQVLEVAVSAAPEALLYQLKLIESGVGERILKEKWASRTLDIDILFYDEIVFKNETLTIPHPSLQLRRFTLAPLCELIPDFIHPVLQVSIAGLLQQCRDLLPVHAIE